MREKYYLLTEKIQLISERTGRPFMVYHIQLQYSPAPSARYTHAGSRAMPPAPMVGPASRSRSRRPSVVRHRGPGPSRSATNLVQRRPPDVTPAARRFLAPLPLRLPSEPFGYWKRERQYQHVLLIRGSEIIVLQSVDVGERMSLTMVQVTSLHGSMCSNGPCSKCHQ